MRPDLPSPLRWLLVVLTIAASLLSLTGWSDAAGNRYAGQALERALASFAIARALNGVISVAQGTELSVEPAGIGVTFAPGEILDPLNDLVERFSWVMLASSVSIALQQLLLKIGAYPPFAWAVAGLGLLAAVMVGRGVRRGWEAQLVRTAALLLLLRFLVPAMALTSAALHEAFLAEDYAAATRELEATAREIQDLNRSLPDAREGDAGLWDRTKRLFGDATQALDVQQWAEQAGRAAEETARRAIVLMAIFVMETVALPLLFLGVVYGLARVLWRAGHRGLPRPGTEVRGPAV